MVEGVQGRGVDLHRDESLREMLDRQLRQALAPVLAIDYKGCIDTYNYYCFILGSGFTGCLLISVQLAVNGHRREAIALFPLLFPRTTLLVLFLFFIIYVTLRDRLSRGRTGGIPSASSRTEECARPNGGDEREGEQVVERTRAIELAADWLAAQPARQRYRQWYGTYCA